MVLERERETNPSECIVHGSQLRRMLGRGPLAAQDIGSMVCPSFGGRDAKINPVCLEPAGAAVQNHPVRVSQSQLIPSLPPESVAKGGLAYLCSSIFSASSLLAPLGTPLGM